MLRIGKFQTALNGRPGGLSRSDGGEYGGDCKVIPLQTALNGRPGATEVCGGKRTAMCEG